MPSSPAPFANAADDVAIVGGGFAGLAAAQRLAQRGHRVSLYDAGPQLGGRARGLPREPELDNGQHIVTGACHALLELLDASGVDRDDTFVEEPFAWRQRGPLDPATQTATVWDWTPPALHGVALIASLWGRLAPLTTRQRLAALRGLARMRRERPPADWTVADWLAARQQPADWIAYFWAPLCVSALNTAPEEASARIFACVLHETLASDTAARLLIPRRPLKTGFIDPIERRLIALGVRVVRRCRIASLLRDEHGWLHLRPARVGPNAVVRPARAIIVATPPRAAAACLANLDADGRALSTGGSDARLTQTLDALNAIETRPIATLYLGYDSPDKRALAGRLRPLVGLAGQPGHWLIRRDVPSRSFPGVANDTAPDQARERTQWVAVVLSNPGAEWARREAPEPSSPTADAAAPRAGTDDARIGRLLEPLRRTPLPTLDGDTVVLPEPDCARWIVERHATVAATPALETLRLGPLAAAQPARGVWLAGDYLIPGLPSTLEAAVRSGLQSADRTDAWLRAV